MSINWKVCWEPAHPFRPESDQPNKNIRHKTFQPSYVQEKPQMCLILSWHYGRQWLEERQAYENAIKEKTRVSKNFIPPDFSKWLEKRKPNKTRRERAKSCSCCLI
ncbi:uncharacterized protein [Drosophila kikkawai]|uniref:Uncharacterized protein n=1 Tax=Drosophila kikkawai TaxID=30033 RepID=A0A6P4IRK4_DROKI|nr:uncharacterized protein LOC108080780 [Drosophila kikkawai]KAH8340773.1 hypothetical protein KR059_006719 [Drosophila kikkawai]